MDVLHPRCCGLDVHKSSISACILLWEAGRVQKHHRRFTAMTQDLRELAEWLRQFGVSQVAMESSGVYWKPVWNILEGQFTVVLANAQHIKNVPGRKTDQKAISLKTLPGILSVMEMLRQQSTSSRRYSITIKRLRSHPVTLTRQHENPRWHDCLHRTSRQADPQTNIGRNRRGDRQDCRD